MNKDIDMIEILSIIKNKYKFMSIITMITTLIGLIITVFILEPVYETNTTILINNKPTTSSQITIEDINVSQKLAITYSEIIKSRRVISKVIEDLDLNITVESLASNINVGLVKDTEIINIKVNYNDKEMIYKIADKLNDTFMYEVKRISKGENIQIIDEPVIPQQPIKPSKVTNLIISTFLGFMISLFIVFLREYFNDKIKTREDIEKYLNMPVMGTIPYLKSDPDINIDIVTHIEAEAYIEIRTNIEFSNISTNIKTVLITSTKQNEGKTRTISNIAYSFATLQNKKILLIDSDLRKPSIHKQLKITNKIGLAEILMNKKGLEESISTIQVINSKDSYLDVITAGAIPSNPTELISSQNMKQLLEQLKKQYDYIFIDSPAIGTLTDASIISNIVDATILLISSGETEIKYSQISKEKLSNAKANILGVILNKIEYNSFHLNSYYYNKSINKNIPNFKEKYKRIIKKIKK